MGLEPTRKALPGLENKRFGPMVSPKCDRRVNFRGTWDHVGTRETTVVTSGVLGGIAGRRMVTCQSDSSRQCFGHPCLPARTRSLPTRQCFRWQSKRDRCTRSARLRASTGLQHLGSRRGAEDFRQHVTRLASTCKGFLRPRRVLTIRLPGIRLALHIVSPRVCWPCAASTMSALSHANSAVNSNGMPRAATWRLRQKAPRESFTKANCHVGPYEHGVV